MTDPLPPHTAERAETGLRGRRQVAPGDASDRVVRLRSEMPASSGRRLAAAFIAFGSGAVLFFIALVVLWLGQTSAHVYTQGADALVIRAVLRTDTDPVATEKLAGRVRSQAPDAKIDIINEAMGRSLLALQEPWIAQMPDFEVTPLPTLLEIRHPDLLTHPEKVTSFIEKLKQEPEVDFVAYNETAHDRLVKLADATGKIESHALRWLLAACALAGFFALAAWGYLAGPRSLIQMLPVTMAIWAVSWPMGWLVYRGWESAAIKTGDWQRLDVATHLQVALAALAIFLIAAVVGRICTRLRP